MAPPDGSHSLAVLQVHGYLSALVCLQLVTIRQIQHCVRHTARSLRLLANGQDSLLFVSALSRLRTHIKELAAGTVDAPEPNPVPQHDMILHKVRERVYLLAKGSCNAEARQVTHKP